MVLKKAMNSKVDLDGPLPDDLHGRSGEHSYLAWNPSEFPECLWTYRTSPEVSYTLSVMRIKMPKEQ